MFLCVNSDDNENYFDYYASKVIMHLSLHACFACDSLV